MNHQQQQGIDSKQGWSLLIFAIECLAYCWEIFMRIPRTMGAEYPGWPVRIGALCAFPLFLLFTPPHYGGGLILPWWWLMTGLIAMHLVLGRWSRAEHSHYIGDSIAWKFNRKLAANRRRMMPELGLAIALASVTAIASDMIAKFILVSAVSSCISLALMHERDRRIAQRFRNQQSEAMFYGDMFEKTGGKQ